ncbi:MAG: DUF4382 domain-containing protein [Halobacteriaceae archaeon]
MRQNFATVALALAVVLAGCAGGLGPGAESGGEADAAGTVQFYVSDERNAIDQFEHLNVTLSTVGFQRAGGENVTNGSDIDTESGSWVTRDANNTTVDLTELQGANATLVDAFDVPAGNYTTVFAHVSEVNGTLTAGEQVNVKLPSEKLQLHTPFTVGPNESVDFVFDITVFEAGKSGKYILKPVVSESGTDVEIEERGDDDDSDDSDESEAAALNATIEGPVRAGENVTVTVTNASGPVANATVTVNGEEMGLTAADGTITVAVPDAEDLELTATNGDVEVELERPIQQSTTTASNTTAA